MRFPVLKYTSANVTFTLYQKPHSLPTFHNLHQISPHADLGL